MNGNHYAPIHPLGVDFRMQGDCYKLEITLYDPTFRQNSIDPAYTDIFYVRTALVYTFMPNGMLDRISYEGPNYQKYKRLEVELMQRVFLALQEAPHSDNFEIAYYQEADPEKGRYIAVPRADVPAGEPPVELFSISPRSIRLFHQMHYGAWWKMMLTQDAECVLHQRKFEVPGGSPERL
ncbi:hypothetical protein A3I56_00485 [Candidatus Roizmanbacteria bacterium RIFCSPLOWO2_02_FULL_43_10]|nr:MAG: hypothetical protein A3I56_00485 [Candidatus Roizmanbacteria bacterium RIFCSPLOWO2_02_FULL_43_10]